MFALKTLDFCLLPAGLLAFAGEPPPASLTSNRDANSVSVLDMENGNVIATVRGGKVSNGIAVTP